MNVMKPLRRPRYPRRGRLGGAGTETTLGVHVSISTTRRTLRYGLAATLLLSVAPTALHAEGDKDEKIRRLENMMLQMQSQIKSLKAAVGEERVEGRRTREKIKAVASKGYAVPQGGPVYPANAIPAFVTADKKLQFGALTITPGGFVAAESVFRSRTEQADIGSQYQGIPFGPQAATNEFRFTARQSRIAALVEAPITPSLIASGYGEFDFLGSGVTSNENESNSFVPRIRHLYSALDFGDYGFHVLAGQTWSLATLNSKGITPRNEVTPPSIDSQYVPGFVWKRQPQIRITKDFDKRLWVSLSAEESQNVIAGCTPGVNATTIPVGNVGVNNLVTCQLTGNNNLNNTTNFSMDHVPDVVGKIAYEAKLADRDIHLEGFGLYRDLYDRAAYPTTTLINPSATNHDKTGYGVGGGIIVPVLPKRLDFQASGMYGRGIGSYGTAQFSDATFDSNGSLSAIPESMLLGGLTAHVTPAIDVYAFAGVEQVQPHYFTTGNDVNGNFQGFGYGVPTANNSGCFNTITVGSCAGNTKRILQLTGGMWDKIYKGAFGEVRVGVQYSYTQRELFQGNSNFGLAPTGTAGTAVASLPFSPKQNEQTVLTSFRYYPFQ